MSDEWEEISLGDAADFVNGYPFKPADLSGSSTAVIRIKQLLDPLAGVDFTDIEVPSRNLIDDGDLIFSWSGTLASKFWDRGPAALNQHLFRVSAREGSDLGWLHLVLDHAVEELMTKTHGTTMKHVTKKVLEAHSVIRPPLTVQRRIVDLLAHLDNYAANLRAEHDALAAFQDALTRDLTTPRGHWRQCTVGDVATFAGGYAFPERFQGSAAGEIPFFKVSDMNASSDGKALERAVHYVDRATLKEMRAKSWPPGTVVFPKVGAALLTEKRRVLAVEGAFDNNCMGLVPGEDLTSDFLHARLSVVRLGEFAQQGAVPSVNQSHVASISISLPPLEEQRVIGSTLNAARLHLARCDAAMAALDIVREKVLSLLLTGQHVLPKSYDALLDRVA